MLKLKVPLLDNQLVSSLILEDSRSWDVELVNTIFSKDVAVQVLQVPISRHGGVDFVSWPHTRFGCYTVRSGYNLARACKFKEQRSANGCGLTSGTEGDSKLWKSLWSVKAPGKMKINLWRFAHDCLPSGHQLQKRHIPACPDCIFCGRHESIEHALLFCQYAREVWEAVRTDYPMNLQRKGFTSTRVWTLDFLERCSDLEATAMVVTTWHIWDARNRFREGEPMMHPRSVAEKALAYIQMIIMHLYKPSASHRRESNSSVLKWSPPPADMVLVNVDAAIFSASRRMGLGVVI
jgi:hypothetical protein